MFNSEYTLPRLLLVVVFILGVVLVGSQILAEAQQDKTADAWCAEHHLRTYTQIRARDICLDPKTRIAYIPE